MKNIFFIIMIALMPALINSSYGQQKTNEDGVQNELLQKKSDEKMYKYVGLSDEQITKIQAIKKAEKTNWKAGKDDAGSQNALLLNMATMQQSIDNLLLPVQRVKMRKYEMKENYKIGIKQKVQLSQKQEEQIEVICGQSYDKQQIIINDSSISEEDVKRQIGKLNNETSDKITDLLTAEQKNSLK